MTTGTTPLKGCITVNTQKTVMLIILSDLLLSTVNTSYKWQSLKSSPEYELEWYVK